MADQALGGSAWTENNPLFDSRDESVALRSRRLVWVILSGLATIGYVGALCYHGFTTHDSNIDDGHIVVLVVIVMIELVVCLMYATKHLPEFRIRNIVIHMLAKVVCDFGGVYMCYFILSNIKNHTRGTCWIFTSLSAYSLALFRIISPTFDFSLPSLLAQVAMNESMHKKNQGPGLTIGVGFACFSIIVLAGSRDVRWFNCSMYGEEQGGIINDWNPLNALFESKVITDTIRIRRFFWACASMLAIAAFIASYLYHIFGPGDDDKFPYWIFIIIMAVMLGVQLLLAFFNRLPHVRLRNRAFNVVFKVVLDGAGVYGCLFLLSTIESHTNGGACWMYFALALDSLAFFKVLSPSFDFSVPSIIAQVAMNESLNHNNKGHFLFQFLLALACFSIFSIQAALDIGGGILRQKFMEIFGKAGNPMGICLGIVPHNNEQEMVVQGGGLNV